MANSTGFFRRVLASVLAPILLLLLFPENNDAQILKCFTEPIKTVNVSPPVSGILVRLNCEPGDRVEKGDLLAELDQSVLKQSRRFAKAKATASAKLESAKLELNVEQRRFDKLKKLQASGNASSSELDASRAKIETIQKRIQAALEEQKIASIDVDRIDAEIDLRKIRSPIAGTIIRRDPAVGEFVSASETTIVRLVDLDRLKARFFVMPELSRKLQRSESCLLRVDGNHRVRARIDFHSPVIASDSGTIEIHVSFDNTELKLRAGCTAELIPESITEQPVAAESRSGGSGQ